MVDNEMFAEQDDTEYVEFIDPTIDWNNKQDQMAADMWMRIKLLRVKHQQRLHKFKGTVIPQEFLYETEATIEEETGTRVNRDDIYNRLQFLERRYQTFKSLVEHPNTRFEPSSNKVFASEKTWTTILKKNDFAGAYTKNGEPEFKLLKMLFSGDINVSENDIETVALSDNTIDLNLDADEGQCEDYVSGYNHDSHLLPRKLFNESSHSRDCESSNSMEIRDRELGQRPENFIYHGFDNAPTRTVDSSNSSSCASSNPTLWWRRP
ncbi:hypothetical protein SASPL_154471 [Salvia splendens]|uniref:Myb/SANT-like domain-containing protein n=1 Tax=Salvia splendens TaxID=180675 RepID=A0A8X8W043_SALSN|nr:hypothetical protein SASPL_154471 [Salvia splendens]